MRISETVSIRLHQPVGLTSPAPALLWIHGGGYVLGCPEQDDRRCRRLANDLGITVAAVRYRLAPEHPYPASLKDCYTALEWLCSQDGIDGTRIAIGGASAGGGLAAALSLLARDRGQITPVLQLLVYPMLDDRTNSRNDLDHKQFRVWSQRSNTYGWSAYLGDADPATAVPARCENLSGLPPAWIGVGTHDLFHDENMDYAARLSQAGVTCRTEVVPGAFHGFDYAAPRAKVSQAFIDSQHVSLRKAFTLTPP
ncbi:MAG: alpha/beta hydrolase [Mycobacterium sp.]